MAGWKPTTSAPRRLIPALSALDNKRTFQTHNKTGACRSHHHLGNHCTASHRDRCRALGIDPGVKQYSGYLDDDENDKHLFYCEFETSVGAEVVGFQPAINLTLLRALSTRDPNVLDFGATDTGVKQYSGYLDDDENDKHLFYCEFETSVYYLEFT
jgi:L-rhamnose mutarotase